MSFQKLVQAVVTAARKGDRLAGSSAVTVGKAAHRALVCKLEGIQAPGSRRVQRAEGMRIIRDQLREAGLPTGNLARSVQVYHVSLLYGSTEANEISARVLAAFGSTLQRIAKREEWVIKPKHADACRALWARVVAGEIESADVAAAVRSALGKKPPAARVAPSPVQRVIGAVAKLDADQQRQLYAVLHKKFADQPDDADQPDALASIPIGDPPGDLAEVQQPASIRDRVLGRRRAG